MATTIRSPPSLEDYTTLDEYQSRTPVSFSGGKPILHYHAVGATAYMPADQLGSLPFFPADSARPPSQLPGEREQVVDQKVDIFVNSEYETSLYYSPPSCWLLALLSPLFCCFSPPRLSLFSCSHVVTT